MAGFGETLRQARAHKNVTLREAEQATRINRHHLAALEDENFSSLPPLIYQRGFVRNYALYLGLDASKMAEMFETAHGTTPTRDSYVKGGPPIDMPSHWAPNFAMIAFAVVLTAIMFAWGYSIWVTAGDEPETPATEPAVTTDGDVVADVELATELPSPPPAPTQPATETPETEQATNANSSNEVSGRQDVQETTAPTDTQVFQTGIAITATADISITFTVDGQVVYEGPVAAGQQTDMFTGTDFSITTSSGISTFFINSCGDTSVEPMSQADEPVLAEFSASSSSCPAP